MCSCNQEPKIYQWRGVDRAGIYPDEGLLKEWPEEGPEVVWEYEGIGNGFGSPIFTEDKMYIIGELDDQDSMAFLFAFEIDGELLWKTNFGPEWVKNFPMNFIGDCPLIIVMVYDANKGGLGNYFNQPHGALQATSACIQNMMLQASELGLDSLWFTFFDPSALGPILGVPEELDIAGAIMIGRPAAETKPPKRLSPAIHQNTFK